MHDRVYTHICVYIGNIILCDVMCSYVVFYSYVTTYVIQYLLFIVDKWWYWPIVYNVWWCKSHVMYNRREMRSTNETVFLVPFCTYLNLLSCQVWHANSLSLKAHMRIAPQSSSDSSINGEIEEQCGFRWGVSFFLPPSPFSLGPSGSVTSREMFLFGDHVLGYLVH
jgi:hypothetical protein